MKMDLAYIPGQTSKEPRPLDRFLPPVPDGVATRWIRNRAPGANWVLEPFGASPKLAVELARAGYRVIVVANNPVSRFLLETFAQAPQKQDLQIALAELASLRRGEERLEPHIRSLYLTTCNQCGREIEAHAYIWDRDSGSMLSRIYHCPACGEDGEFPALDSDKMRAAQFSKSQLHHVRALERVTSIHDPDRHYVEEALATYLPRAEYALFTLINKLDGLDIPLPRRQHIHALLISACDYANNLWAYSTRRPRPKQLSAPPRFMEHNIWLALETAISQWESEDPPVPLVPWPEKPPITGGISLFEGRIRHFTESLEGQDIDVVLSAIPRPNQAFWTLSALWSGWLWGQEALGPFKAVLRRKRYDWAWHSEALYSAFSNLYPVLNPGTPFFGLMGEIEPGFLSAAMIAAEAALFDLIGMALRAESGQAQITWTRPPGPPSSTAATDSQISNTATEAATDFLCKRAEPSNFIYLQAAALNQIVQEHTLIPTRDAAVTDTQSPSESLSHINSLLERVFHNSQKFNRYGGSDKSLEAGKWWFNQTFDQQSAFSNPISDRIEIELIRYLLNNPGVTVPEIDAVLCELFPGLLTPNEEFVNICIHSYAEETLPGSQQWQIQKKDLPKNRRQDVKLISDALGQIGYRLGFKVTGKRPLIWTDEHGQITYVFYIFASTAYGEIVFTNPHPAGRSFLVIPGGRAVLAIYKQRHNPYLSLKLNAGWRYLKFRHVHHLLATPFLTRENLDENLALDPITVDTSQLRLL